MNKTPPVLQGDHIKKSYGTVQALSDASLAVFRGSIHGLVGENGAGKSTLMRICAGIERHDGGTLVIDTPRRAIVPQYPRLAGSLPVWQNMVVGVEPRIGPFLNRTAAREKLHIAARSYRIDLDIEKRSELLNGTELRLAAILAALIRKPELLILDEPTVGLADRDQESILETMESLRAANIGVLYISHDLKEVSRLADTVTVLFEGRSIVTFNGPVQPEALADAIFRVREGNAAPVFERPPLAAQVPQLPTQGVHFEEVRIHDGGSGRRVGPISFEAPPGTITAITGVRESGLDLLEGYLAGETRIDSGAAYVGNERLASRIEPADLRRFGAVYLPSDRFEIAAALDGSVEENVILRERLEAHPRGIRTSHRSRGLTRRILARFGISTAESIPLGSLSGGTIQKLILARELERSLPACIIAEPFSGLDLRSQEMLSAMLREISAAGTAVVVLSSSIDTVCEIGETIYVLSGAILRGPFGSADRETISRAFAGLTGEEAQ